MTPNNIEILIHYRCSDADHPRLTAPTVQEACSKFFDLGLLSIVDAKAGDTKTRYVGNLRALSVYVDALCAVPLPTREWIIDTKNRKEVIK